MRRPEDDTAPLELGLTALPRILFGVTLALLTLHLALQTFHYRVHELPWLLTSLFDVDEEQSLPTWYSALLLALASVLLLASARLAESREDRLSTHWYGLAFGFALLSMDEIAGLHETLNALTDASWTGPAAWGVLLLGLAYLPFLFGLPSRTRFALMAAGVVYLGGALGVERASDFWVDAYGMKNLGYQIWTAGEEGLEMIGVIWLIHAMLAHLSESLVDSRSLVQLGARLEASASEQGAGGSVAERTPREGWTREPLPPMGS